jgi:uncharacterized protein YoaH (UPF0181 family)
LSQNIGIADANDRSTISCRSGGRWSTCRCSCLAIAPFHPAMALAAGKAVEKRWKSERELTLQQLRHDYERALENLRHTQNRELEELRAVVKERQDLAAAAISIGSATHLVAQERRVQSIHRLWEKFVEMKEISYWRVVTFQSNIVLAKSDEDRLQRENISGVDAVGGWQALNKAVHEIQKEIDRIRPFVGEKLYLLYWTYTMFVGFASIYASSKVYKSSDRGTLPIAWFEYEKEARAHLRILQSVVNGIDVESILAQKQNALRTILDLLEREIVREVGLLLSGASATRERIEEARRLAGVFSAVQRPVTMSYGNAPSSEDEPVKMVQPRSGPSGKTQP